MSAGFIRRTQDPGTRRRVAAIAWSLRPYLRAHDHQDTRHALDVARAAVTVLDDVGTARPTLAACIILECVRHRWRIGHLEPRVGVGPAVQAAAEAYCREVRADERGEARAA